MHSSIRTSSAGQKVELEAKVPLPPQATTLQLPVGTSMVDAISSKRKNGGLKVSDSRKGAPVAEEDLTDDDNDPFELKDQAQVWLKEQASDRKRTTSSECYKPYDASRCKGQIPESHWDRAFEEFRCRFMDETNSSYCRTGPSVLLVATGVEQHWTPGEGLRTAKFLFFPELECGCTKKTSALFITYMTGKEHGAADTAVNNYIGKWILDNKLNGVLNGGLSSGDYAKPQPDRRVFPKPPFGDGDRDIDRANGDEACSRLVWEVEYKNRNPIDMRKNGKRLMKSPYNRLYLAAKIYEPSDDGTTEAAIVLWGRTVGNDNDDIHVLEAVSFGTKDLSEEHKNEFAGIASRTTLVGVDTNEWRRPQEFPPNYPRLQNPLDPEPTPDDLFLNIPLEGILYKILIPSSGTEESQTYLTDLMENNSRNVTKMKIDLRDLLDSVLTMANKTTSQPSKKRARA